MLTSRTKLPNVRIDQELIKDICGDESLQNQLLVWVALHTPGIYTYEGSARLLHWLAVCEPIRTGKLVNWAIKRFVDDVINVEFRAALGAEYEEPAAHELSRASAARLGLTWVRWESKRFLGQSPTHSQKASISRALKRLEEKGFVTRKDSTHGEGKKHKTESVRLTPSGFLRVANEFF